MRLNPWDYEELLTHLIRLGYRTIPLREFDPDLPPRGATIVMRHDVDLDPMMALMMARLERSLGVSATYFLRWCTSTPYIVKNLRILGHEVGFHYESLAQLAVKRRLTVTGAIRKRDLEDARERLRREINRFRLLFGPLDSICAHGHPVNNRIAIPNNYLVEGQDILSFGVRRWAYDPRIMGTVDIYASDAKDSMSLWKAADQGYRLIYALIHPNRWHYCRWLRHQRWCQLREIISSGDLAGALWAQRPGWDRHQRQHGGVGGERLSYS
jgi:hypothetical protein